MVMKIFCYKNQNFTCKTEIKDRAFNNATETLCVVGWGRGEISILNNLQRFSYVNVSYQE